MRVSVAHPPRTARADLPVRSMLAIAVLASLVACAGSVEDRLAEVRALQDAGQFQESIDPLREIIARQPDLPDANYLLGVALVQTGQLSLAVWPLEKAASDPSYAVQAGLLLANTFLSLESFEDAVRAASKVLEADPGRTAALQVRGHALLGAGRREEALQDTARLVELAPDDYPALLLHGTILSEAGRLDEAETVFEQLEEVGAKSDDPSLVSRGCLARASFYEDNRKDEARAEAHYLHCLEKTPADPLAVRLVSQFFDERDRPGEATAIHERAVAAEPENLALRGGLASRYEARGEPEKARALLKEAVELLGSAAAWAQLSDFERRNGNLEPALEAIDEGMKAAPTRSDQLLFAKAELLIELGRLDEAEQLIEGGSNQAFKDLVRGRILLARGDASAALAAFEEGLRRWPGNAGGRYYAALAARELGDWDRAAEEFRQSVRADAAATDAALLLANLELARGNREDAAGMANVYISKRGGSRPEGYLVLIQARTAAGNFQAARESASALEQAGFPVEAAVARAGIETAASGPAAATAALRASGLDLTDPANESALRALIESLLAAGQADEAVGAARRATAAHSDASSLRELEGAVLLRAGRDADAQAAFEKALAIDPGNARAKSGLAEIAARAGDPQRAIALYDEAARANPKDAAPAYAAAQLVLAGGDRAGARERLEQVVRKNPGQAGAHNDLAWLLADSGEDLDRALVLARTAYAIDPSAEVTDTIAYVHLQRGEVDQSVELFEQAVAKKPESPSIRYHLGLALARQGERGRAETALREALDAGPFPEAEAARSELARLASQ